MSNYTWATHTMIFNSNYTQAYPLSLRRKVAGHELLHSLGFMHHSGRGMVTPAPCDRYTALPTSQEVAVLRAWYDQPVAP